MKTMKKLFALVLAMVMLMALALPVMAEGEGEGDGATPATYKVTIAGSTSNTVAGSSDGHTYEAYQILAGDMLVKEIELSDGTKKETVVLSNIQWGTGVKGDDFLADLKDSTKSGDLASIFSAVNDASKFAEEISKSSFTTAHLEKVAQLLQGHLNPPTETVGGKEAKAPYEMELPAGYYLIKDKADTLDDQHKDYTDIILHVAQDVTVYHKGSVPTVEKEVSELGSQYGKSVEVPMQREYYYKLIGTLPSDFGNYSSYMYEFVDTLDAGIEISDPAANAIVNVYAVYTTSGLEEKLHGYALNKTKNSDGTTTLSIKFDDLKHDNAHPFQAGDKIIVIYKAKLNKDAAIGGSGNDNSVYLKYSNNPNDSDSVGKTAVDSTTAYTFGIKLTKTDGDVPETKLEGVQFVLYRESSKLVTGSGDNNGEGTDTQNYVTVREYAIVENGKITGKIEKEDGQELTDDQKGKVLLTTGEDGVITVEGLDSGVQYYLEEISTKAGYNKIVEPIPIFLTATIVDGTVASVVTTDNVHINKTGSYLNGTAVLGAGFDVPNYTGEVLPSTGGMGTTLFYVLGSILVIGAVVLLVTKKRMTY